MTRSLGYTRLRRVVMQVALCASLAVGIALAWWVGRIHAAALAISLDEPRTFPDKTLSLDVRLPTGWKTEIMGQSLGSNSEESGQSLIVTEQPAKFGSRRILQISVFDSPLKKSTGNPAADAEKVALIITGRPAAGKRHDVKMLGAPGFLFEFPLETYEDMAGEHMRVPEAVACTLISGPRPYAVCVHLVGVVASALAPADIEAVMAVAQALKRTDPAHPLESVVN